MIPHSINENKRSNPLESKFSFIIDNYQRVAKYLSPSWELEK
jgi:hypothetical protein